MKQLAKEKVSLWLERALIDVTNRVGVDINRAVRSAYYAHLLPYVSGLGPRKAELILKKINGIVRDFRLQQCDWPALLTSRSLYRAAHSRLGTDWFCMA